MEVYNVSTQIMDLFSSSYIYQMQKKTRKKTGDKNSLTLPPIQGLVCIPNLHRKQLDYLQTLLAFLELK